MINIQQALSQLASRQNLTAADMSAIMRVIMRGEATPAQMGALLMGLRLKGETVTEITAAARVMREFATGINITDVPHVVDIVGTGGDGAATFNVSTASMFVAAAAGCHVAKHGNRSVSSSSGSADVLELAGVVLNLTAPEVERCVREIGLGFMFAPVFHGAMRAVKAVRSEIGIRTIFNILGPLTNPAQVPNQVLGVWSQELLTPLAEVLQQLGSHHALVVHGKDGLDEISIGTETTVAELVGGNIKYHFIHPQAFGINPVPKTALQVASPAQSLAIIQQVLNNEAIPAKDAVALNAAAAIYAAGVAGSIKEGYAVALEVLRCGKARTKFVDLINFTQNLVATRIT